MPLGDAADSMLDGCTEVASKGVVQITTPAGETFDAFPPGNKNYGPGRNCRRITEAYVSEAVGQHQPWFCYVGWEGPNGEQYGDNQYRYNTEAEARSVKWSIRAVNDDCVGTAPDVKPLPP
jgi:hypothetical protein